MNILVFSPHPDDDIIGCGGSIVKHVKNKHLIKIVYMTNGDAGDLKYSKNEMADIRKKEITDAKAILGFDETIFLNLEDGYIEYETKTINKLTQIIRENKPDIIYFPHELESHRDHSNTYILVNEAIKRAAMNSFQEIIGEPWYVPIVLCYEVWTPIQEINYVEDITAEINIKLEALKKHSSQLDNVAYDQAIRGLNRYRGAMTGMGEFAECFKMLRTNKII